MPEPYLIGRGDATRVPLPDQSVDLVMGSPPYCDARTYDDGTLPAGHVVSRRMAEATSPKPAPKRKAKTRANYVIP